MHGSPKEGWGILIGLFIQIIGIAIWEWDVHTIVTTFFLESVIIGIFVWVTIRRLNLHQTYHARQFKVAFPVFILGQLFFFFLWNITMGHRVFIPWLAKMLIGGAYLIPFIVVGMLTAVRAFFEMQRWLSDQTVPEVNKITGPAMTRIIVQQFVVIIGGIGIQQFETVKLYGYLLVIGKGLIDVVGWYAVSRKHMNEGA